MRKFYDLVDKSAWQAGPWLTECDGAYWIDGETHYPCALRRNMYGTWNGYVGVDEDHPLFRIDNNGVSEEYKYIDIHGGVLSTDFHLVDDKHFSPPKKLWWISLAAIHPMDMQPEMNEPEKKPKRKRKLGKDMAYRDYEYMKGQVEALCQQLAFFDARIL